MKICPKCLRRYDDDRSSCPEDGTELRSFHGTRPDSMIGRILEERWVIEERIGEGGMGAVYRAQQLSVDRKVAIKTMRTALTESEEYVGRFFREANIASTINHPHYVSIYDFGQTREERILYLVMEYLEGRPLAHQIYDGGLTLHQIFEVCIQICAALAAAHNAQIVHRDLKPENIFLLDVPGDDVFVKVLDFGIAKVLDERRTPVTRTGQIFGTPEYMSPEQCRGIEVDARSDLYSLGCILFQMLTGRTPFRSSTPVATLMKHCNDEPPTLGPGGLSDFRELEELILQLLAKNPDARYDDALEVRDRLVEMRGALTSEELERRLPDPVRRAGAGRAVESDAHTRVRTEAGPPGSFTGEEETDVYVRDGEAIVRHEAATPAVSDEEAGQRHTISQMLTITREDLELADEDGELLRDDLGDSESSDDAQGAAEPGGSPPTAEVAERDEERASSAEEDLPEGVEASRDSDDRRAVVVVAAGAVLFAGLVVFFVVDRGGGDADRARREEGGAAVTSAVAAVSRDAGPAVDVGEEPSRVDGSEAVARGSERVRGAVAYASTSRSVGSARRRALDRASRAARRLRARRRERRERRARSNAIVLRDSKSINETIARERPGLDACYESELGANPDLGEGEVAFSFHITGDGEVRGVDITSDEVGSAAIASCIRTRVGQWEFGVSPTGQSNYVRSSVSFTKTIE